MEFNGANAPYNYDKADEIALGSGTQELTTFLHWKVYPRTIDLITDIKFQFTLTENSSVRTDAGESFSLCCTSDGKLFSFGHPEYGQFPGGAKRLRLILDPHGTDHREQS